MDYSFEDTKTGEVVLLSMSMDDAVPVGTVLRRVIEGKKRRLRRIPERETQVSLPEQGPFTNFQVKRGSPDAEGADYYDEKNRPCWHTKESAKAWADGRTDRGLDTGFDED